MHLSLSLLHGFFVRSRRSSSTNRNVYLDLSTTHSFVHGKNDTVNIDSFFCDYISENVAAYSITNGFSSNSSNT